MIARFWIVGAFVTSLSVGAVMTLLIIVYLRFRSRIVLAHLIAIIGSLCHLIAEFTRILPLVRQFGEHVPIGYMVFTVLGTGLTVFSLPNLAMEVTTWDSRFHYRPILIGIAIMAASSAFAGILRNAPIFVAVSGIIDAGAGMFAALFVLSRKASIIDHSLRRIACVVASICTLAMPLTAIQQLLWARTPNAFGKVIPPYPQVITLFLVCVSTLILLSKRFREKIAAINRSLDPEAVYRYRISPRECDIILQIGKGYTNEEIASVLFISTSTVKNHISHIYAKTGFHNRVELVNAVLREPEN